MNVVRGASTADSVRARRPPAAVTFDYWNTLCEAGGGLDDLRAAAVGAVLVEHGVDGFGDGVDRACAAARVAHEDAWRRNEQFLAADAVQAMLRALDPWLPADGRAHDRVVEAYTRAAEDAVIDLVPGVADALRRLADDGIAIGIVCDVGLAPSPALIANLDRHGVLGYFTHWSFSDAVGVYKPDPRIFAHALAGLRVSDPGDAWHIGDLRRTDIAGARGAGLGSVRVTVAYDDPPESGPEADAVISDYEQLPAVLGLT